MRSPYATGTEAGEISSAKNPDPPAKDLSYGYPGIFEGLRWGRWAGEAGEVGKGIGGEIGLLGNGLLGKRVGPGIWIGARKGTTDCLRKGRPISIKKSSTKWVSTYATHKSPLYAGSAYYSGFIAVRRGAPSVSPDVERSQIPLAAISLRRDLIKPHLNLIQRVADVFQLRSDDPERGDDVFGDFVCQLASSLGLGGIAFSARRHRHRNPRLRQIPRLLHRNVRYRYAPHLRSMTRSCCFGRPR